jgi:hypothetical protein
MAKRRKHVAAFKARGALEAVKGAAMPLSYSPTPGQISA